MRVRMKRGLPGLHNGRPWPKVGELVDLPEHVVASMAADGLVELDEGPDDEQTATPDTSDQEQGTPPADDEQTATPDTSDQEQGTPPADDEQTATPDESKTETATPRRSRAKKAS